MPPWWNAAVDAVDATRLVVEQEEALLRSSIQRWTCNQERTRLRLANERQGQEVVRWDLEHANAELRSLNQELDELTQTVTDISGGRGAASRSDGSPSRSPSSGSCGISLLAASTATGPSASDDETDLDETWRRPCGFAKGQSSPCWRPLDLETRCKSADSSPGNARAVKRSGLPDWTYDSLKNLPVYTRNASASGRPELSAADSSTLLPEFSDLISSIRSPSDGCAEAANSMLLGSNLQRQEQDEKERKNGWIQNASVTPVCPGDMETNGMGWRPTVHIPVLPTLQRPAPEDGEIARQHIGVASRPFLFSQKGQPRPTPRSFAVWASEAERAEELRHEQALGALEAELRTRADDALQATASEDARLKAEVQRRLENAAQRTREEHLHLEHRKMRSELDQQREELAEERERSAAQRAHAAEVVEEQRQRLDRIEKWQAELDLLQAGSPASSPSASGKTSDIPILLQELEYRRAAVHEELTRAPQGLTSMLIVNELAVLDKQRELWRGIQQTEVERVRLLNKRAAFAGCLSGQV